MKVPNPAQRAALRELLTLRLEELRGQLRDGVPPEDPEGHSVTDRKDLAEASQEVALREVEEDRDRLELAQVEAALWRLDNGGYGTCTTCGGPIGVMRLMAWPAASHCVECQQEREQARVASSRWPRMLR